jgi:hypothetical protein
MMRLILAHNPMEGIEEKLLNHEIENQAKNTLKITKMKNIAAQYRR